MKAFQANKVQNNIQPYKPISIGFHRPITVALKVTPLILIPLGDWWKSVRLVDVDLEKKVLSSVYRP